VPARPYRIPRMTCRNCGTEIADKALICYRCGTATTEPKFKPPVQSTPSSRWPGALALLALVIAGLFMGRAVQGDLPQIVGYVLAALAAIVLVIRIVRRR
jgi:hypothetical protein